MLPLKVHFCLLVLWAATRKVQGFQRECAQDISAYLRYQAAWVGDKRTTETS